jgi:hypothetical protein
MIMQIVEQVKNTNDYNDDQKKHVINKHLDDLRRNLYSSNNCREITIESLMAIGFMTSDEQKESHELFNETCKRTVMRLEINRINGEEYNPGKEEMDRLIETCFPNSRLAQEKDLSIKDARATEKSIASAVEVISVEKAKRTSNPVNLMARMPPKINIDKKEMEKIYAEFLIKHEWSEWTTTSLARETGISQPTWYRRIKKDAKFLAKTEEVLEGMIQDANDKLKNIPSIMRYISDLKEELETKKKNNKERSTSGNSILINNLPSDKYSEIDRFANNYDEDIIINLSRGDLIEEISNINDHIKREELESWSLDKLKNYFRVLS